MSSDPAKRKKIDTPPSPSISADDDDHRKRRRNRTTLSCLHCHGSKRMCDRKRPCGRCTQLGITGLCMYEIDDPNQRVEKADDKIHLQRRVAELEGVIRELKNRPHPRWTQLPPNVGQGHQEHTSNASATSPCPAEHSSRIAQAEDSDGSTEAPHWAPQEPQSREGSLPQLPFEELPGSLFIDPFNVASSSSSTTSPLATPSVANAAIPYHSALALASPADDTMASLLSYLTNGDPQSDSTPFADLFDSTLHDIIRDKDSRDACLYGHQTSLGECSCLSEATNYYAVLELSLRLRHATEVLSHYPLHNEGSMCLLKQRITDLDVFTSTTLGSIDTPGMSMFPQVPSSYVGRNPCSDRAPPEASWVDGSVAFAMSANFHPRTTFVTPSYNSLMSWTPQQHWNVSMSSAPTSRVNVGSQYSNPDTSSACPPTRLYSQHLS